MKTQKTQTNTLLRLLGIALVSVLFLPVVPAPAHAATGDFDIKQIDIQLLDSPAFNTQLPPKPVSGPPKKWLAVEVTFNAKPELTAEITFNYYILVGNNLLVGSITHVDVAKGNGLHSVAYLSPKDLAAVLNGKTPTVNDVVNATVTVNAPGVIAPITDKSWKPSKGAWWESMKQEQGRVLSKPQTPFAPLWWDYYEAVKITR